MDVGFGSLKSKQAAAIIEDATRLGPLKLEETRIITGNKTSNIESILSPEEFFQRSGIRSGRDPRAGQPYSPSGSYTFEPNGAVLYRPPGPGQAAPPPRWVPWTAAALQGNVNER